MDNSYDDFSLDFGHMMTAIERDDALIFLAVQITQPEAQFRKPKLRLFVEKVEFSGSRRSLLAVCG